MNDRVQRLQRSAAPGLGIALTIGGGACFTLNDALMKWLRADYPVGQAIGLRGVFSLLLFCALIRFMGGWRTVVVRDWRSQLLRALMVVVTTVCFIGALRYMPLADALGIAFAGPLFTVLLAGPLLGEQVGWRRWTAAGFGFAGVLLMVNPTGAGFQLAAVLPLGTAMVGAFRDLLTRRMSLTDHSNATLFVSMWAVVVFGAASAPFGWLFPEHAWVEVVPSHLAALALAGALMACGQYMTIEALRVAEAGLVAPFKYTSYLWAVAIGVLVWSEIPAAASLGGAALVVTSGLYIFWRERALRRAKLPD